LLRRLERGEGSAGRYDAVLIDEAQDFACSWFKCAKLALKEPDEGDLVIVGDGSQSLYANRTFNWADAGVHARGRTINKRLDLDKNYRNTVEILHAAHSFAGSATQDDEDSAIRRMKVVPATAVRHGPWPLIVRAADAWGCVGETVNLIQRWLTDGVEIRGAKARLTPNDVGVLYPRLLQRNQQAFARLCEQLAAFGAVVLSGANPTGGPADDGVKITTIHSAKGLQFRAAILLWGDLLPSNIENRDDLAERMLFYVALTRSEDVLAVVHSGASPYVAELEKNISIAHP
jgi:superfamily I DNA/RNA helicase